MRRHIAWYGRPRLRNHLLTILTLGVLSAACASSVDAPEDTALAEATSTSSPPVVASTFTPVAAPGASITVSAVGDVSLAREVVARMEANGADFPYALIAPLLAADVTVGNLEGALTDRGDPWPKSYNFRAPPRFASGLVHAGFDVVSLANNHTMDFGVVGLRDTLGALDAANVGHVGAGVDASAASSSILIERHGLTVAFIGCVDTPTEAGGFAIRAWAAHANVPGLFICDDAPLTAAITSARATADFVVVLAHAGDEFNNAPNVTQRRIAETALAAGADAYIGAHAHVVQPIERRGRQLIAWGLGNFIFDLDDVDLANIPKPRVSLVLKLTFTKGSEVTFEAIPVTQDEAEDRPRPATADEAAILHRLITP